MNNQQDENNNPTQDIADSAKNAGKKAGNAVLKQGKKLGKKAVKKGLKKAGTAIVKTVATLLGKVLAILAPYLLIILAILLVIVAGYYVLYEIRGSEQIYVFDKSAENETKKDEDGGYDRTSSSLQSSQTSDIQTYYKYMSQHSYWQIITDDNTKLERETEVVDYYNREKEYLLNANLLFALDETMHRKKFIYPEQFVKPVNYDPEKLELKPLTDEDGKVIVESVKYDKNGEKTDEKIKNVADYGIGSIFKYKKDEKNVTVEGVMYKKEVWNSETNQKESVDTNEPFSFTMDGYPQEIHLMTKAITFTGEFEFIYQTVKTKTAELDNNSTPGADNEAVVKVQIGVGKEYRDEEYEVDVIDPKTGKTKTVTRTRKVFVKDHPLYGYRKGGVYETIPVLAETKPNDKGQKYLRDFLYNYEIYTPDSVMDKFNLVNRVGSDNIQAIDPSVATGSGLESGQYKNALHYFDIIRKYASMYGVDPYIVLAKMTQESGGNPNVEDGLMQITGNGARTVKAKNILSGQTETFTVYNEADRRNPDKAIRWGVMYFANLQVKMDGDPLKALQAYNFGEGGVLYIKKNHPEDWKTTAWMKWREESRLHYGGQDSYSASYDCIPHLQKSGSKMYGDSCYVEHVMRYYGGSGITEDKTEEAGDGSIIGIIKDSINGMISNISDAISSLVKDYSEETKYQKYKHFVNKKDVDYGLRLASAMEKYLLFSKTDTDYQDLSFWEEGYSDAMSPDGAMLNWEATEDVEGFQTPLSVPNASSLITSLPGYRTDPFGSSTVYHRGTDIAVPKDTPVYATADGTVIVAQRGYGSGSLATYGHYVQISHGNNIKSLYAHLNSVKAVQGQTVKKGELIGFVGTTGASTGYHLHFEMTQNGLLLDSSQIIKGEQGKLKLAPTK